MKIFLKNASCMIFLWLFVCFCILTLKVWRKVFIFGTLLLKLSGGGRHQPNRPKKEKNLPSFCLWFVKRIRGIFTSAVSFCPRLFFWTCLFVCCEEKQISDGRLTQNINVNLFSYADWNKGCDVHWHKTRVCSSFIHLFSFISTWLLSLFPILLFTHSFLHFISFCKDASSSQFSSCSSVTDFRDSLFKVTDRKPHFYCHVFDEEMIHIRELSGWTN